MEDIAFIDALRNFSEYFYSNYRNNLSTINEQSFSNGYLQNSFNKQCFNYLNCKINNQVSAKNFLTWCMDIFKKFSEDHENLKYFNLEKKNDCVIEFLSTIIDFEGKNWHGTILDKVQISQLMDVYFAINEAFTYNSKYFSF